MVSSDSNDKKVVCLCNHLTSFAADFFVAPNPIDFNVIAKNIANIANNLAVLLTLVGILVMYIVGIIFCRRQDKKDIAKVSSWTFGSLLEILSISYDSISIHIWMSIIHEIRKIWFERDDFLLEIALMRNWIYTFKSFSLSHSASILILFNHSIGFF